MSEKPIYVNKTRTGDVFVRDFDKGIVESMGAVVVNDDYFLMVDGISYGTYPYDFRDPNLRGETMPGVMVHWASPDDRLDAFVLPCIVVRRDSIDISLERWPSFHLKYRSPADGASHVNVNYGESVISGYTSYEEQYGGFPYNIVYMISALTSGKRAESDAIKLLKVILRAYKPRNSFVRVTDSEGAIRTYDAYSDGPVSLEEALDIVDRQRGYAVNVTVEAELDLNDPYVTETVRTMDFNYNNSVV